MKNRKKNCRCQTKQSDTSQQKDKQKMKKLNCVNKQFSKENNTDTNVCADNPNTTVQKISNGSISKILNSHDFSNSNTYKLEEYCTAYQYDKLSNVGHEEGEDMCKVSSETLFSDHKDIDYHLVKSVKIEQDFDCNSRENDSNIHNLDTPVFNISDTCTSNDRPSLTTKHIHPKIKEEEVSIINESIITIELQPVSKIEELPDIREIKRTVLDESCSDKLPDNCNEGIETKNVSNAHKPLKATEAVKREMETNLQLQNEVQTLNWSSQSERQIKLETNTRDYDATVREDEYVNELCVADENMQLNSKNNEMCQNQSSTNSKPTIDRPYVYEVCKVCKGFNQLCHRKVCRDLHTGERLFDCTVCGRAFKTQSNLTAHKRIHTGEKPFGCSICGKVFLRQDALTIHKRIHTGDRPFSCTVCGKVFTHHYILTAHKRVHTGDRPFVCTVCGKAFTHHSILTGHKRIHTGEKPFECTICGKTFTRLCGLTGHKRIHTGEKPFGCTICGKAFILQCQLSRHKHTHTGEKPFGCTICGKAFTEMCYLKQHKRIHTGERPFVCTVCGKAFTARHVLTRHKRIHTGEKPFGCSICGKVYRYMESLTNHSKREHT